MIVEQSRKVYTVERYGRRKSFFSLRSACQSLARQIIQKKYPSEHSDIDDTGWESGRDFYWQQDIPRAGVLYRRMTRIVQNAYEKAKNEN